MPYELWRFECCGRPHSTNSKYCSTCGQSGVHEGWHLSMHEAMARYQYFYQFKPVGPHRDPMHRLLDPLRERCTACQGRSIVTEPRSPKGWYPCTQCEGVGSFWVADEATVQAARAEVLKVYPDAGAPPVPEFLTGMVVQDLGSGMMIGVKRRG